MAAKTPSVTYNISGRVKELGQIVTIKAFRKRDLIINDQFGNELAFEAVFEVADMLDSFPAGTQVDIDWHLESRSWWDAANGINKWFTSAKAVSVRLSAQGQPEQAQATQAAPPQAAPAYATQPTAPEPTSGEQIPF